MENWKKEIGVILRELCRRKGVEIIEAELCPDHIHMLVSIPPEVSVSSFVGYLKGKSTLIIFERHASLKYKYGEREFWCRGYFVSTVGKNKKVIQKLIIINLFWCQILSKLGFPYKNVDKLYYIWYKERGGILWKIVWNF